MSCTTCTTSRANRMRPRRCARKPSQVVAAAPLQLVELAQCRVEVPPAGQEVCAAPPDVFEQELELAGLTRGVVVQLEDVSDLGQGEAQPPAPQDQFQPDAVAGAVDPAP